MKYSKTSGYINSEAPNILVSIDFLGPIKTRHFDTKNDYDYFYITVMKDTFSRFCRVSMSYQIKTSDSVIAISRWSKEFGYPQKVLSD